MTSCKYKTAKEEIYCYTSSEQLPEAWDTLIPPEHFLNRHCLHLNEKAQLDNISYRYVLITTDDKPIAAAQFQLLNIRRKHLNEESLHLGQKAAWRLFTSLFRPGLLVAGHLFRHDISSFYCANKTDTFEAYRLYKKAIDTASQQTCASAILIKDVPAQLITYFQHNATKYLMLRNDISMELSIDTAWGTIHGYEKALKHKYAQRFRKVRNAGAELVTKELNADEVAMQKARIYMLYKQVCEKQPARIGMLNEMYIPLLKEQNPDTLKVWGMYKENELVAFYSAWVREEVFDMFYIGFDYQYNQELMLYFNILFRTIEESIILKKKKLILGRTALDAKARLGCTPRYLSTFLFIRNRFMRMAVQQLQANAQTQEGAWEQRHPMKGND